MKLKINTDNLILAAIIVAVMYILCGCTTQETSKLKQFDTAVEKHTSE